MSKRDYRKKLIAKEKHKEKLVKEAKERNTRISILDVEAFNEKKTRNDVFQDLRSIFQNRYSYNFQSYIELPPQKNLITNKIEDGGKYLHPLVEYASQTFHSRNVIKRFSDETRTAGAHLLGIVKKSILFSNLDNEKENEQILNAIYNLAIYKSKWIRTPESWKPTDLQTPIKQTYLLIHHLLAKYPMPEFFDKVWLEIDEESQKHQNWYVNIASGENIRTQKGLPCAVTKKIAHYFMKAPQNVSIKRAFRWGQVFSMGGNEKAFWGICSTPIVENGFVNDDFWLTVIKFFIDNPLLDTLRYRDIFDYIEYQKYGNRMGEPPQPNFSMRGREPNTLMLAINRWHQEINFQRDLARTKEMERISKWESCGVHGLEIRDGNKIYMIKELLTADDLFAEGKEMHHCVGSYAHSCHAQRTAIYSLSISTEEIYERLVTIELSLFDKTIVQAKTKYNGSPSEEEMSMIRNWANKRGLKTGRYI